MPLPGELDALRAEAGDDLDVSGRDGVAGAQPESAAGRELVGVATAVGVADSPAAQHPHGLRAGHLLREGGQGDEGGQGGVAGADDRGALAAEAGDVFRAR